MRILLINDFRYGGGAEVVFNKTFDVLIDAGYEVEMAYGNEKIISPKSVLSYIFSYKTYNYYYKKLIQGDYNLVYILNFSNSLSPSLLYAIRRAKKRKRNIKVIYNAHDAHLICPNSAQNYFDGDKMLRFNNIPCFKNFIFKRLDHRGHIYSIIKKIQWIIAYKILHLENSIDKILCPSYFLCNRISKVYPHIQVKILRNPIESSSMVKSDKSKLESGIKLVYFGRISNEKGLLHLVRNLTNIKQDYKLDVYGDGPDKNIIDEYINNYGLTDKIFLKGIKPWTELMKVLHNYDAFILPSQTFENAPLSIVEAAFCGLSILTMDYGGMKEMAELVGNYYFISPINEDNIKKGLKFISEHKFESNNNLEIFSVYSFKKNIIEEISNFIK